MNEKYERYMMAIPIVPEVATKIMELNEDSESLSSSELTRLITLDPYLSASILKIANSALYSRRNEIKELDTAVNLIGFRKIKTMVLLLAGASLFKKNTNSFFYKLFWSHSIISAFVCRDIADLIENEANKDEFFTASLIHRIGEVPLYLSDKDKYLELIDHMGQGDFVLSDIEMKTFNVNSCLIGGELLTYWEFPEDLIKSAKFSSSNDLSYSDPLVDSVTLSDIIANQLGFGIKEHVSMDRLEKLLSSTGLSRENYDYLVSEAYLEKMKMSGFFKECQSTLNVELIQR